MRIDSGVCTAHERIMISKVTQMACGRPASVSAAFQLVRPDGWIGAMPSQVVKLSATTPISGMTPNARNMRNAGRAIHRTEPLRPPLVVVGPCTRTAGGGGGGHFP